MHNPRQIYIPPNAVLGPLYKVDKLIDKYLVTSIHVCPAYSMYLSDKSGNKVSLALVAQAPAAGATAGVTWWADAQTGIHRKACDETGSYTFTPLFSLRRPIKRNRRWIRDTIRPDPEGDELWYNDTTPWDPLDEDGEEDEFDPVSVVLLSCRHRCLTACHFRRSTQSIHSPPWTRPLQRRPLQRRPPQRLLLLPWRSNSWISFFTAFDSDPLVSAGVTADWMY
jgi:hypothetical protein